MSETDNRADDLGNIDLFDESKDDIKKEIILLECNDNEVDQSIFGILALPENLDKKEK